MKKINSYAKSLLAISITALVFTSCKNKQKEVAKVVVEEEVVKVEKPNIVLLFVDDYGWSDIGYRNQTFTTPNLDQFKKESLDFNRAYIPTLLVAQVGCLCLPVKKQLDWVCQDI